MQPQRHEVCVKNDEYKREQQCLAKQKKARGCVDKRLYLCILWGSKNMLAFSNSFNVIHTVCLPSHTFHTSFIAHAWPTSPKAWATPTNPQVLVQMSWRCAWGIHCEYIFTFIEIPTMTLIIELDYWKGIMEWTTGISFHNFRCWRQINLCIHCVHHAS